jgi:hypothetical protein
VTSGWLTNKLRRRGLIVPISLVDDEVLFHFPNIHRDAVLTIGFQNTLRVPDDGTTYGLPPGLGPVPLRRVADLPERRVPQRWMASGGVVMPMWQSQACWLDFSTGYPFLVKVGAGSINAITGKPWSEAPDFVEEDYIEVPNQPWLDGFCVEKGKVRQFVAMPLHNGYTVEEQVSRGEAVGGIRLVVIPLKAALYEERKAVGFGVGSADPFLVPAPAACAATGLGAGGEIRQSIETPVESPENWELETSASVWVHIANSVDWRQITGERPPTLALSAADYTKYGFPWFDWYDDTSPRSGSDVLARVKSVHTLGGERSESPLPENESFDPPEPIGLGYARNDVSGSTA